LHAILEAGRPTYEATLDLFSTHQATLHAVGQHPDVNHPSAPYWGNQWFSTLDAASLMGPLLSRRSAQYVEIGSGHSTRFARYAIDAAGLATTITSIDPEPRVGIDKLIFFCRATTRRHGRHASIRNNTSWPRCCRAWRRHFGSCYQATSSAPTPI
jgi:hypothetical protein